MDFSSITPNHVILSFILVALAVAIAFYVLRRRMARDTAIAKRVFTSIPSGVLVQLDAEDKKMGNKTHSGKQTLVIDQLKFTFDHMQSTLNNQQPTPPHKQSHRSPPPPSPQHQSTPEIPLPVYADITKQSSSDAPAAHKEEEKPDIHSTKAVAGFGRGAMRMMGHPGNASTASPSLSAASSLAPNPHSSSHTPSPENSAGTNNRDMIAPPPQQRELPPELQPISCGRGPKR